MREQFEKLPEIAKALRVFDVIFDGENYSAKGNHSEVKKVYALGFVNGAWYSHQEQQKIIDRLSCNHLWTGRSENQYCSKCGEVD